MTDRSEQLKNLEEAVRLLESARAELAGTSDFDEARLDGYLVTALTSARSALSVASGRAPGDETSGPEGQRKRSL